jgi:hypothetical protein
MVSKNKFISDILSFFDSLIEFFGVSNRVVPLLAMTALNVKTAVHLPLRHRDTEKTMG